ncbi:hypothetical protein SOVF_139640 [Spinacia oleracea]|uniref:Zinc finger BED domain-containing protein RICESLEEPER 3-like n=1 Tax=Spinacia oleracea TaxID=3562 RepID=A0A9R0HZ70_SPIOL|nr:zinc finger BED domain-containing protein RICESLEEPER 3-like [Spinacia oleracea]KNA10950.1 hypothetical protein SOVF_139640 [Spinacia oleracea]
MDETTGESITPTGPSSEDPVVSSAPCEGGQNQLEQGAAAVPKAPAKRPATETATDAQNKGKKKRSWLWDHFELIIKNGEERAKCVYCPTDVCGSSKTGTSVMKNHLLRCKEYPPNIDKSQRLLSLQSEQSQQSMGDGSVGENVTGEKKGKLEFWKFKQEDTRKAFAKMIIMDEMPFRVVEREGFQLFALLIVYISCLCWFSLAFIN